MSAKMAIASKPARSPHDPTDRIDDVNSEHFRIAAILQTLEVMSHVFASAEDHLQERDDAWEGLAYVAADLQARCERIYAHSNAIFEDWQRIAGGAQ